MRINNLCKKLALLGLFEHMQIAAGGWLPYFELQRLWALTGLRRNDLDDALADAVLGGDIDERYTESGRVAVLVSRQAAGQRVTAIEQEADARSTLRRTRTRVRRGVRLGRRSDDPAVLY